MSDVRRVYAEKKPEFAVQAKELQQEIKSYLGITGVTGVRILIRYDVENISEEVFEPAVPVCSPSRRLTFYIKREFPGNWGERVFL